jgi:hypothetical protein
LKRRGLVLDARGVLLVCGVLLFAAALLEATDGYVTNLLTGIITIGEVAIGIICIVGALRAH